MFVVGLAYLCFVILNLIFCNTVQLCSMSHEKDSIFEKILMMIARDNLCSTATFSMHL